MNITVFLFNDVRAYFSFRCHVEFLRLNIFLACDLRAQFARILIRRLLPCCRARRIWARISVGEKIILRARREIRPYIHWQLTSTSSRIMEISTRVVGEIGWERDNLPNVQLQTFRRCALGMVVLARGKSIIFVTSLRINVLEI